MRRVANKRGAVCPKCGGAEVIWDDKTQSYVCLNANCGKEWRIVDGKVKYVKWI